MGIQRIEVKNQGPQEFVEQVSKSLSGRELGKIVSVSLNQSAQPSTLLVTFSKLGSSELTYQLHQKHDQSQNLSFEAVLQKEKIALTHRVFRNEIELKLAKVLELCGATLHRID